ncbi:MAG: glycosyltransferase, partial [Chloroflexota bacterium]
MKRTVEPSSMPRQVAALRYLSALTMTACSPGNVPHVSVIVCTYRAPASLQRTLWSLVQQALNPTDYEIIVVDNRSSTETADLVTQTAAHTVTHMVYCAEPQIGLSHARNRGIDMARAPIVAFIDDDAEADSHWLASLLAVYRSYPDAWAVGGRVRGLWELSRPLWLTDELLRSLSLIDRGDELRALAWPERIIGANMSFRRSTFEKLGNFNTHLGRSGSSLIASEDTEIQQRIHRHGGMVYYTPQALVWHHVPQERTSRWHFYQRAFGHGRSQARLRNLGLSDYPRRGLWW